MVYTNQLANAFLFIGVVSAYRGADNRLVSGYADDRQYYGRRSPDIEYHYPDEHTSNQIARGHHVISPVAHVTRYEVPTSNQGPWHRHHLPQPPPPPPPFTSHVSHIRQGGGVNKDGRKTPTVVTTGLTRTSQWGTARVPYRGAVVNVYPSAGRHKTYRGMVTTTVLNGDGARQNTRESYSTVDDLGRSTVQDQPIAEPCYKCPTDRAVVASRGMKFVLMEKPALKPCHYKSRSAEVRLELLSGAKAGSVLHEGTHVIVSRMIYRQQTLQTCQFRYTVIVRKCPPLTMSEHLQLNCTSSNAWGSKCQLSCNQGYQPLGPTLTECGDQLNWSQPLPHCIAVSGCSLPISPENGRLSCTTSDNDLSDLIPEGTTCRYECNAGYSIPEEYGAVVAIECGEGEWNSTAELTCQATNYVKPTTDNTIEDAKLHRHRHRKHRLGRVSSTDPCRPNPCEKGDRCLPGPYPALALCSCPVHMTRDGQRCRNVFLIERLIPGKEGHEKKKKKSALLLGQVYEKTASSQGTEIGA